MNQQCDQLAIAGGTPVRDLERQPWPAWPPNTVEEWRDEVEPALRRIYLSGTEGLPALEGAAFGRDFAVFCGSRHGVLMPHGTNAITAAVTAALDLDGLSDGGEIVIPNYTFIATASAPLSVGCSLCLVDVDPQCGTMDPAAVEAAIGPRTRALMPVHIAGHTADMDALRSIADKHDLAVIEDAAHAHGAEYKGRKAGSLGHVSAFSFQSSKNLTSGEGGTVTTDDGDLYNRVLAFQDVGRHPAGGRWEYPRLGWNYRTSEYLAALLRIRLAKLPSQIKQRSRAAAYLSEQLPQIPGIEPPHWRAWVTCHSYHLYAFRYDPEAFGGQAIDKVTAAVRAEGIPICQGYRPLAIEDALRTVTAKHPNRIRVEPCPNVEKISPRTLWLSQSMLLAKHRDLDDIVEAVAKVQHAFTRN